jgi:uncharacterized protein
MQKNKNLQIPGAERKPIALDLFYEKDKRQPLVIYAHGFNGFKDWGNFDLIAEQFVAAGLAFLKFNFSHNGTSPANPEDFVDLEAFGNNNYSKELFDLGTVIDWVCDSSNPNNYKVDTNHLFLIGHSMGGGIVLIKAAEDQRIKGVTTWAAIGECKTPWGSWNEEKMKVWKETGVQYYTNSRTKQQMPLYYQLYEDYRQNKERLDIVAAMKKLNVPVLICHGTADEAVPYRTAEGLKQANENAEIFLLDSDHVFGRKHPWTESRLPAPMQQIVDVTIKFFKKLYEQ